MRINIFAVFLVFLFLVMPVSSAATADVEIQLSQVYDFPSKTWANETTQIYNSHEYFLIKVRNLGPDGVNVTINEKIPSNSDLVMYQVYFSGGSYVKNHTSYNPNNGVWSFNLASGKQAYLNYEVILKSVADVTKTTYICNLDYTDPNLFNNQKSVILQTYREYPDNIIRNGAINSTGISVKYQIKNNTKWTRNIKASSVAVQKYTVYAQDMRNKNLFALNKYTGNNRWYITLDRVYDRAQFLTGKYLVLMSSTKAVLVNLYTHKAVWGKTYQKADSYSLIKSKKNGKYYIMTTINGILKFFKINLF